MAVPSEVAHIWSRDGGGGTRTYLGELDVTISDMIQDELDRLETQGTKDFYEQPSGSGAITAMEATYPSPLTTNGECNTRNEDPPLLEWTIDRGDKVIFQQCVFLNGEVLTESDEGLDNDISSGGACNGAGGNSECSFEFELPGDYPVASYLHQSTWPADNTTVDVGSGPHDLGEITTPENYQVSFIVAIDLTEDFSIWKSIWHVSGTVDKWPTECYPAFWFAPGGSLCVYHSRQEPSSGSDWASQTQLCSDAKLEAGKTYDARVTNVRSLLVMYIYDQDGGLVEEKSTQGSDTYVPADGGQLYVGSPWYVPPKATISDVIFRELEVLDISKHSYCVETKFCPTGTTFCDSALADKTLTVTRCTTGLQYDGTPADVFPRMMGTEGVSITWLDTRYEDTSGYRVYKYDASVPFAEDTSARLLQEIPLKKADCGLTHNYLDFRDATTGSQPGLEVGYAIVPLDAAGDEIKDKVGISGVSFTPSSSERRRRLTTSSASASSTSSGFIVTWFGDIRVKVEAEGGGPVEGVIVAPGTQRDRRVLPDGLPPGRDG